MEGLTLRRWTTLTPDGRLLVVDHDANQWTVQVGEGDRVQRELLDLALIQALRSSRDVAAHSSGTDYAEWTRNLAHRIGREAGLGDEEPNTVIPSRGDRIELLERAAGVAIRGTVEYADYLQVLVNWDDGRSSSLRVGLDRFRVID
jgi:hypothetical protein